MEETDPQYANEGKSGSSATGSLFGATRLTARHHVLTHQGHGLCGPLSAMMAYAESLSDGLFGDLTEAQAGAVREISTAGARMLELIQDLTALGGRCPSDHPAQLVRSSLKEVVARAAAMVREFADATQVGIKVDAAISETPLRLDAAALRQAAAELLAAMVLKCGRGAKVTITAARADHQVQLLIAGTPSPGTTGSSVSFAEWKLRQIDEANVQHLVRTCGGTLTACEDGEVVMIRATFPGLVETQPPTATAQQPAASFAMSAAPVRHRVLIADDDPALLAVFRHYLESHGFDVSVASSGDEAIAVAKVVLPDLVLMDLQMPLMDGVEAIGEIRNCGKESLSQIPIIGLTGLGLASDRERCLNAGASACLMKPCGVRELEAEIRKLLPAEPA